MGRFDFFKEFIFQRKNNTTLKQQRILRLSADSGISFVVQAGFFFFCFLAKTCQKIEL